MSSRLVPVACAVAGAAAISVLGAAAAGAAPAQPHTAAAAKATAVAVYVTHVNGPSAPLFPLLHTVTPIQGTAAGPAIKVGDEPTAIAITPNGKTAYVANSGAATSAAA
jgi:DNA-binding beta-propeller fold protein YncE